MSDWPSSARWYPITIPGVGEAPESPQDFSGRFAAGYHIGENALYVAVDVVDESTVVDTSDASRGQQWNGQDGCEIFLDIPHTDVSAAIQYSLYGDTQAAILSEGGVFPQWKNAVVEAGRVPGRHAYEWKIDIGAVAEGHAVSPHTTMSLDVAVVILMKLSFLLMRLQSYECF